MDPIYSGFWMAEIQTTYVFSQELLEQNFMEKMTYGEGKHALLALSGFPAGISGHLVRKQPKTFNT